MKKPLFGRLIQNRLSLPKAPSKSLLEIPSQWRMIYRRIAKSVKQSASITRLKYATPHTFWQTPSRISF